MLLAQTIVMRAEFRALDHSALAGPTVPQQRSTARERLHEGMVTRTYVRAREAVGAWRADNTSWYSDGHRFTTALSGIFIFGSPLVLAFAFRRLPSWRNAWLPTLAAIPAFFLASILFSLIGDGASNRAGALTWFVWLAFVAFQLLKKTEEQEPELLAGR